MTESQGRTAGSPHVWETTCGLLISEDSDTGHSLYTGECSYRGVCYCEENDNSLVRCPYGKKECPAVPAGFPLPMCPCHRSNRAYDYERSLERLSAEIRKELHRQYQEITGGHYCACVETDNGKITMQYDVNRCIQQGCKNDFCVIRKQPRDLHMVNIYYDVRRTWTSRRGLLEDTHTTLTRGLKVFSKAVTRTDAELWMEANPDYGPLQSKEAVRESDQSPGAGIHDFSEFCYQVENVRIAHSDRRDSQQDQQEFEAGVTVIHAADQKKTEANEKRAARTRAKERRAAASSGQRLQETMEQIELF